jgi:hypothetical protein
MLNSEYLDDEQAAKMAGVPQVVWERLKVQGALGTLWDGRNLYQRAMLQHVIGSVPFGRMKRNAVAAFDKERAAAKEKEDQRLIRLGREYQKQLDAEREYAIESGGEPLQD